MKQYVVDTHALIWQLCSPSHLGQAAQIAFTQADDGEAKIHIPVVVVAEMAMIAQKQRVPGFDNEAFDTAIQALQETPAYIFESLSLDSVLASRALSVIPDIFDRLVVTDAMILQAALITKDVVIQNSGVVPTIWD